MAYAILRTAKLKTWGNIGGSLAHNYRDIDTPNADPNKYSDNIHYLSSADEVKQAIQNRLPEKHRKDAVLCIEYLITASPEWEGWDSDKKFDYFAKAQEFLVQKHGAENVVSFSVHNDETTPHLIAYVVPIDSKGKLNCKEFLGGRAKLNQLQTDFAEAVKELGLERGKENSKATHKTIKEFYSDLNHTTESLHIERPEVKKGFFESVDDFSQKVVDKVMEQAEKLHQENRQLQIQNKLYREQIEGLNQSLRSLNERVKPYIAVTQELSLNDRQRFNELMPNLKRDVVLERVREQARIKEEQERIKQEQERLQQAQLLEQRQKAEIRERFERFNAAVERNKADLASKSFTGQNTSVEQENTLKTQNNAVYDIKWDRDYLKSRGLTHKQVEYCMSQQTKVIVATLGNKVAQQERLQSLHERLNQAIDNNTLDSEIQNQEKGR